MVSSYAIDDGGRLLLFDPLALPSEIEELLSQRETAIVLTAPWHERDTQTLVERYGLPVYTPLPDTAEQLMEQFGITAEQAGEGSPDLRWLLSNGRDAHPYTAGDRLPFGVDAFAGHKHNDLVLWVESRRAIVAGDTFVDFGRGFELNERWLQFSKGVTRDELVGRMRPLLELPIERVLLTHGAPTDRAALERALTASA
jgi:glyoxylase-like metal-dependent hydrolase (beta-lactamase superfamily II)